MLINKACMVKVPGEQLVSLGEQYCESGYARRATRDTVAAAAPGPSHGVASRDVDRTRIKCETPARPHRHIKNRAGRRWHTINGRPTVLIDNAQGGCLCIRRIRPSLAGLSAHQNSDRKNGCDPKNQPYCIRYFHTIDPFLRASFRDFVVSNRI